MASWDELMVLMAQTRFTSARGVVHSVEPPDPELEEDGYEVVHRFVVREEQWKVTTEDGDLVGLHDGTRVLRWEEPGQPPVVLPARRAPYVLHEPLGVIRRKDVDDWQPGEDYAVPVATPQNAELLGRTCWHVDLRPPSHKSGLLSLWIDGATGIRLRSENSEVGLLDEVLELEVDGPVDGGEFVFTGQVDPASLAALDRHPIKDAKADRWFHVSSSLNRESILEHGLQAALMGRARGIAGSRVPERPGCFLASHGPDFFVHMNNTGGLVDVWEVLDVDPGLLLNDPDTGFLYLPAGAAPEQVRLVESDLPGGWPE